MPCGCGGNNSSSSGAAGGPLLSTSLDSRFGTTPPATAGDGSVSGDLMSLFSTPTGWIGILFFVVAAGAVAWASARTSE
jgi:hypothetical protein